MSKKIALFLALLLFASSAAAQTIDAQIEQTDQNSASVYFFWNPGCPYCRAEQAFLDRVEQLYPDVKVKRFNISESPKLFEETCKSYGTIAYGWPRTFIGTKAFYGYTEECPDSNEFEFHPAYKAYAGYKDHLLKAIEDEFGVKPVGPIDGNGGCSLSQGLMRWLIFILIPVYALAYMIFKKRLGKRVWLAGLFAIILLCAFVFVTLTPKEGIKQFASGMPFPVFVFIIALLDGFNPCAFTVLAILLSLLTYTKSKRKMVLIGSMFIITSGAMYFIFIMALLLAGSWFFSQYGLLVLRVLGAAIVIAGAINVKDYFFFKKGVSLTISQDKQTTIYKKARGIVQGVEEAAGKKALAIALLATIALAAFVNLVELGCSAILPAAFMASLLQTYGEAVGGIHILYTAFYSAIYVIPLFAILFNFLYFFKSERLSEKQGRLLKLAGGLIMLLLGTVMLLNPELLVFA